MNSIEHLKENPPIPRRCVYGSIKVLNSVGINETRLFAHYARIGYDAAIRKLEEL
jgi:hypothetical protein